MRGNSFKLNRDDSVFSSHLNGDLREVRLTNGNDEYVGGSGGEHILALKGDDRVIGGSGDDAVDGGGGNDALYGQKGRDQIDGGNGDDSMQGGAGRDLLIGGEGDDGINGNAGTDVMIGGLGADDISVNSPNADGKHDRVVYESVADSAPNAEDQLSFFATGEDKIDLSQIDAVEGTPENDGFRYIGKDAFTGAAGELRFDGTYIEGDVNGDGLADLRIEIGFAFGTDPSLRAHDFVL